MEAVVQQAKSLQDKIVSWRRDLHRIPELRMETPKTEAYIASQLREMGIEEIQTGVGGHGICAYIRGAKPGKCLAIRADCDGLPIREETGLPFASQNGNMHACGHDAHSAMALGAAKLLLQNREKLKGDVKLIFQPYEEGDGGAKAMIAQGVLDGVDAMIALHNHCTPEEGLLPGDVLVTKQETSANIYAWEAAFRGPGSHVCLSRTTPNPVYMACKAVAEIADLPVLDPETVNAVTVIQGGTRNNIVPNSCTIAGSIRAFDRKVQQTMVGQVREILDRCAKEGGGTVEMRTTIDLMGTRIDPVLYDRFCKIAEEVDPVRGYRSLRHRDMIGEDFARFADRVPGMFFFLHTKPEGSCYPLHNPKFDVNESVLYKGSALFAAFALSWQDR